MTVSRSQMVKSAEKARGAKRSGVRHQPKPQQPINGDEAYPTDILEDRLGIGPATFRRMKRAGLRVAKIGSRHFVTGKELIRFITASAESSEAVVEE